MPTPNTTSLYSAWGQMLSTTYNAHKREAADAISNHNALFRRLDKKGLIRVEQGGATIVQPVLYQGPGTFQRYQHFDKLNVGAADSVTSATYAWKQASVSLALSGAQMRRNQGKAAAVKLVNAVIKAARAEMANGISSDIYSDGTAANQIGGLQLLIADAGTGTVGDINSATTGNAFWKNIVQSAAAPLQGGGAITPGPTTIQSLMLPLYLKLTRGAMEPDLIIFSDDYYTFYEQSLTPLKLYTSDDQARGSFISLKYRNADVYQDTGGGCPSAHGYFINTDNLEMVVLSGANFDLTDELKPVDQDAIGQFILFEGNLTTNCRKNLGVMKA